MRALIAFLIIYHISCTVYAQAIHIDSLEQVIKNSKSITDKTLAYKTLLNNYGNDDAIKFQKFYTEGIAFTRQNRDKKSELEIALIHCLKLYQKAEYTQVITTIDSLLPYAQEPDLREIKAKMLNYSGNAYSSISDYTKALVQFIDYLAIVKTLENKPDLLASANNNIGMAFLNMKRFKQAIPYLEESLKNQTLYTSAIKANTLWNLGICYMELKKYDKALSIFEEGVSQANLVNNAYAAAGNQLCIGAIYSRKKDFKKGIATYTKAYEMSIAANLEPYRIIEALNGLIWGYNMSLQPEKAALYVAKVDSIIEKNNLSDFRNRQYLFFKSSNLLLLGKPQEADIYFSRYEQARDSLHNVENLEIIQEKEIEYKTKEKEQMLQLQKAELESQQLLIALISSGAILLIFIGFLIYRQQQLKIAQQQQEQKLKEALYKVETTKKLEEQRLRISKELHDNIGSQLTYLASAAQNISMSIATTTKKESKLKLDNLAKFSQEAITDLRDTIWVMNRGNVSWEDLKERVTYVAYKVSNTTRIEVTVNLVKNDSVALSPEETLNMFRIIQEAINNAVKHANPSKITITISPGYPTNITITDNGTGFKENPAANTTNGIKNMKSRAYAIQATINITSDAQGTTVTLVQQK